MGDREVGANEGSANEGARPVYFRIFNGTGFPLIFVSNDTEHGRWFINPPRKILAGMVSDAFAITDKGAIGPEGTFDYKLTTDDGRTIDCHFGYNHPMGAPKSAYTFSTKPPRQVDHGIDPPEPVGHKQCILYRLKLAK